jgi:uncharacterized protein YoxC
VAYSTEPARLKAEMPAELKAKVFASPDEVRALTDQSFEMHQPLVVKKSCLECHNEWKEGQICSVMSMRFSSESFKAAEQSWIAFVSGFRASSRLTAIVSGIALAFVLTLLVGMLIHYQLAAPLKRLTGLLQAQSDRVRDSAGQFSSSGHSLAEGASEQAASIEETSASLEELSSMTRNNAESVQKVNDLAKQTRSAAELGTSDMQAMSAAMEAIKASSGDIAKIIKTIDEIAFQTNILALNAAIEAARAGEAGMGFAVVADEVRTLARRSAEAARETAAKIEGAIRNTTQGAELTAKVAQALTDIVGKARQVDELAAQVTGASREQSQGITQINTAIEEMDKVTQRNAAAAEESAGAAAELNAQAQGMNQAVAGLIELVEGHPRETAPPPPAAAARPKTSAPAQAQAQTRPAGHRPIEAPQKRTSTPARVAASGRDAIPLEGDFKNF